MKLCKIFSKKISINLCVCKNSHQQSSYSYLESFWELSESFRHGLGKNLCLISDQKKKSVANSWDFLNRSQVVPFLKNQEIGLRIISMKSYSTQSLGTVQHQKISWLTEPYCFTILKNGFLYLWVSQGDLNQIVGYFEHWEGNNFHCLMKSAILEGYSVACPMTSLHAHQNHNRFWHILYQLIVGERNLWLKTRNYLVVLISQNFLKEYGFHPLNSLLTCFLMIMI